MGRASDARDRLMRAVAELIWTGSYGRTTIDQICERAGVKKGSFYYFFESKADVARLAIESMWQTERGQWQELFAATRPPLERLRAFARDCHARQVDLKRQHGHVLGCPLCTLGTEVSTQESALRETVERIMAEAAGFLEAAIGDAIRQRDIPAGDAAAKARILYAYGEGLLTQARIKNDPDVLLELESGMMEILGVQPPKPQNTAFFSPEFD